MEHGDRDDPIYISSDEDIYDIDTDSWQSESEEDIDIIEEEVDIDPEELEWDEEEIQQFLRERYGGRDPRTQPPAA